MLRRASFSTLWSFFTDDSDDNPVACSDAKTKVRDSKRMLFTHDKSGNEAAESRFDDTHASKVESTMLCPGCPSACSRSPSNLSCAGRIAPHDAKRDMRKLDILPRSCLHEDPESCHEKLGQFIQITSHLKV